MAFLKAASDKTRQLFYFYSFPSKFWGIGYDMGNVDANESDSRMFGISDSLIILPYLLSVVCVLFAAWFGFKYWNKDDEKDKTR